MVKGNDIYTNDNIKQTGEALKTIISVHKEGKFFVATDLVTHAADQGKTEKEAIARLMHGLEEHHQLLMELVPNTV